MEILSSDGEPGDQLSVEMLASACAIKTASQRSFSFCAYDRNIFLVASYNTKFENQAVAWWLGSPLLLPAAQSSSPTGAEFLGTHVDFCL